MVKNVSKNQNEMEQLLSLVEKYDTIFILYTLTKYQNILGMLNNKL